MVDITRVRPRTVSYVEHRMWDACIPRRLLRLLGALLIKPYLMLSPKIYEPPEKASKVNRCFVSLPLVCGGS